MAGRRRPRPEESLEDFVEAVGRVPTQQLKKALVAVYQGLSPMLVTVMASRVPGLTAATKVGDVSPEQWSALFSGPWKRWLQIIGDGGSVAVASPGARMAVAAADDDDTDAVDGARGGGGGDRDGFSSGGDGQGDGGASSSSSLPVASSVPTTPWISDDGASYYPTTLGEHQGVGDGDASTSEACDDGAVVAGGGDGGGSGWRRRHGGLTRLEKVMEAYYRGTQSNEEFDGLKRRCISRVTATLSKLRERAAEFEDQLAAAQEDKVR